MEDASISSVALATVMGAAVLLIGATVMLQWFYWFDMIRYWNRLPRGSYGWPLFGETFSLMTTSPRDFAVSRVAKYGKVFKTHLYGDPTIMITSPDVARALYLLPYDHVHLTGPQSSQSLLGREIMNLLPDEDHAVIHKLIQKFFLLPSIGRNLPGMERLIETYLNSWDGQVVNTFEDTRKVGGNVLVRMLLGFDHGDSDHLLSELVEIFRGPYYNGILSLGINLPGSGYYKGMKAREKMSKIINDLIDKWENSSAAVKSQHCFLKQLMEHKRPSTGERFSRGIIVDNLMVVIFAGFDTTSSSFSMALRHLWENPKALELVKAEQESVAERRVPGEPLTINDLRDMKYTNQVLNETLRLPGPVPFSFRITAQEVQIAGYTIPKGWKIANLFSVYHQDPSFCSNPNVFDPSRFAEGGKTEASKGFTPFGGGRHLCPGRELAKVNFKFLMHHFLTKFRWEPIKNYQQGYEYFPVLMCSPKGGFPVTANLIKDRVQNSVPKESAAE